MIDEIRIVIGLLIFLLSERNFANAITIIILQILMVETQKTNSVNP